MYLTDEVSALCFQAADETDTEKLLQLITRINEMLLEKQEKQREDKPRGGAARRKR